MKKPNRSLDKSRDKSPQHSEALKVATAEPGRRLNIEIPQSLHARIKISAAEQGITMQELVIKAVNEVLSK